MSRPAFHKITLRKVRMQSDWIKWVQELALDSKYVCGLKADGVADPRTMAEISEMLYRLGHPTYPQALSIADGLFLWAWAHGGDLPEDWKARRITRMRSGFRPGWGITQASWECLHPDEFADRNYVRILPTAVTGGSYGYGDPEGQGGRHWAIDWFGVEGAHNLVVSPEKARVVRRSESTTNSGQVFGGVISLRSLNNNYLWVMRHIDPDVREGTIVNPGTKVGYVTRWRDGGDHIHLELYDERSVGNDRIYVGPPINQNPYKYLQEKGAL